VKHKELDLHRFLSWIMRMIGTVNRSKVTHVIVPLADHNRY